MFDSGADAPAALELVAANYRARIQDNCEKLALAAQWADLHSRDTLGEGRTDQPSEPGSPGRFDNLSERHPGLGEQALRAAQPRTRAEGKISTTPSPTSPNRGGPPGQTSVGNLGPLTRSEHRHKTFG
jgi:hypothetical protein